ncbi:uncharacterized protein LOC129229617 [Uloborus diversus]|uniref:uncharacterized protein LOC129227633 n=1 Tax=Uloborus diversus TaxID=327109 RepID=UPI002409982F|nr:uncharacterized protein LOC129227633 [Uloborus diversus]XP_054719938.1 uncharacterized protein LOC129229617 [Uloborus diversus]
MISAMPAVAVRRGRKRSKTFGRFGIPQSHHSSSSSLSGRNQQGGARPGVSTISGRHAAFRRRVRVDSDLERQRRRFLVYMGTLFLITGLLLVFIGVGAAVPTAQTVGLLLIGVGAVFCVIKVFCSEAHMTDVPQKAAAVVVRTDDVEAAPEESTPLADISEFTELNAEAASAPQLDGTTPGSNGYSNTLTPTSPPNSIPETQVLIANDSGGKY